MPPPLQAPVCRCLRTTPRPPQPRSPAWPELPCRPLPFPAPRELLLKPLTGPPVSPSRPQPLLMPTQLLPVQRGPESLRTGCRAVPCRSSPPQRPSSPELPQRAKPPVPLLQAPPFLPRALPLRPLRRFRTQQPLTWKPSPPLPLILGRRRNGRGARQHRPFRGRLFPRSRQVPRHRPQRLATPLPRRWPAPQPPVQSPVPQRPVPLRGVPRPQPGMPVPPSQLPQRAQRQGQPRQPLLPPLPRRTAPLCCRRPRPPRCLRRLRPLRPPCTSLRRRPERRC